MRNHSAWVIGGPTAAGKSVLAHELARRVGGTIINADSLQLYADLPILTAQPGAPETGQVPHRLYGLLKADQKTNAAMWAGWVRDAMAEARAAGRVPVIVGGTGLYLEALMLGLPAVPPVPPQVLATARAELAAMGHEPFHARLIGADPQAGHLKPGDTHRLLRAWTVLQQTGRSLFDWQRERLSPLCEPIEARIVLPPRDTLYASCDARFASMIERGALEEVRRFRSLWPDTALAARAIGYAPLAAHLRGESTLADAIERAQAATRHYAKRQSTWFRNRFAHQAGAKIIADPERPFTGI